ncbi:unnamed protein product [Ambrosiozyma monospora]|uniref:Unnamed protein product n=1 Tax=Ambrosiozyma monospora TaxID=43982 RepID=A0A9W6YWI6_AMBMO|nr:unnamed protein product [Ambrosiozyma monospora]
MSFPDPSWSHPQGQSIPEQSLKSLKTHLIKSKKLNKDDLPFLTSVYSSILESIKLCEGLGGYRTLACDTLAIWLVRVTTLCSSDENYKKISKTTVSLEDINFLYGYVIDFWNDSGVALGNSLKELFMKLVQFLNVVYTTDKDQEIKVNLFRSWLVESLRLPNNKKVLYFMIENLIKEVKQIDFVVQQRPTFIRDSLNQIGVNALSNYIGKTLYLVLRLMYTDSKSADKDVKWLSVWNNDVINALKNPSLRKPVELYLLPPLFKVSTPATIMFIKNASSEDFIFLGIIKIAQELSVIDEAFSSTKESSEPLLPISKLEQLLSSSNDQLRLAALSILTSSPKASRAINPQVYSILLKHIESNFVEVDLETRNSLYSTLKSFILRIRDSTYPLHRDAIKLTKKDAVRFEFEIKDKYAQIEKGKAFLIELFELCCCNITPGSSYQRVSFAYKLLECLIKSGLDDRVGEVKQFDKHKHVDFVFQVKLYDEKLIRLLVDNICNDFEDIRIQSTEMLELLPSNLKLDQFVDLQMVTERAFEMLQDLRGKSVDSGSRFLQFLVHYYQNKAEDNIQVEAIFQFLVDKLNDGVAIAENDFLIAAYQHSIQGYFAAFKHIFQVYKFSNSENEVSLIGELLKLSSRSWDTVKEMLQNDSPEGNIPKLLAPETEKTRELEAKYGKKPQVLLSYSWRSLKESTNMVDVLLTNT